MTRIEQIFVGMLVLLSLSFVGYIGSSWTSQGNPAAGAPALAATPAPGTETPRSVPPAPLEGPDHVQAACMSKVRGLIPNGTRVNGMSVAYKHSVELSQPVHRQVAGISDINFYTVTVEAEIEGRRFSSRYTCRQWGDVIEIMRS
jgi:hypothetical protein